MTNSLEKYRVFTPFYSVFANKVANPESPLSRCDDGRRKELGTHIAGCEGILKIVDTILTKYNALEDDKRSGKKLWQEIQFGNGAMKDLAEIRLKICTHTQAITMAPNLLSLGSQGRIETQLSRQGGDVQGIRESINWVLAKNSNRSRSLCHDKLYE
jgi:hypothetical protein